eukprot:gene21169-25429_t
MSLFMSVLVLNAFTATCAFTLRDIFRTKRLKSHDNFGALAKNFYSVTSQVSQRVAVVQSGLYEAWVWEQATSLARWNPKHRFDYYGVLQNTSSAAPRSSERVERKTAPNAVDLFREHVSLLPNMQVRHFEFVPTWIAPARANSNDATFPHTPNVQAMLRNAYTAVMRVNLTEKYDFVLRIREDAAWYYPFVLDMVPKQALVIKSCNHRGGYNEKAWVGPFDASFKVMIRYYAAMWDANVTAHNPERLLKHVVDAANTPVYAESAIFNQRTGAMTRFGLTLSDARRRLDGSLCFTRSHWQGGRGEFGCGERSARTVFAAPIGTC